MPWCDARDTRADAMLKGSIVRELILDIIEGELAHEQLTMRLSEERHSKTVPSSSSSYFDRDNDDATGQPTRRR
eukprot:4494002-Pyramimonas_sp.AAC.1